MRVHSTGVPTLLKMGNDLRSPRYRGDLICTIKYDKVSLTDLSIAIHACPNALACNEVPWGGMVGMHLA